MVTVPQINYPTREQPLRALNEGFIQGMQLGGIYGRKKQQEKTFAPKEQREHAPPEPERQEVDNNDLIRTEKQDYARLTEMSKTTSKLSPEQRGKVFNKAVESGYINSELFREAVGTSDMSYKEIGDLMMSLVRKEEGAVVRMETIKQTYGEDSAVVKAIQKKIGQARGMQERLDANYSAQLISAINTAEAYQEKWPSFKNMPEGAKAHVKNKMKYMAELRKYNPQAFKVKAEEMLGKRSVSTRRAKDYTVTFNKGGKKYSVPIAADNIQAAERKAVREHGITKNDITGILSPQTPAAGTMAQQIIAPLKRPPTNQRVRQAPVQTPALTQPAVQSDKDVLEGFMN